ncbi:MAG TPA: DUF2207 domain-containing protein [Propionibacteriaceae bacterium]|nr:DUF2207 domain-containing protein [Propionibacteriaceae bacterium]HPZ49719.1 DUF2207 domain-containing protein [Propionibacteriaceae bacterium]
MLRTFGKWWWYPALMVAAMLIAGIPASMSRTSDDTVKATDDFIVRSFTGDYRIVAGEGGRTDVHVDETFVVEFKRSYTNRGIVRLIPLRYQGHRNTVTDLAVGGSVTTTGSTSGRTGPPPFTSSQQDDVLAIRIGDASRYAQPNIPQTYVIRYTLGDVAMNSYDRTRQEIYLDTNGTGWKQRFESVTATLHVPAQLATRLDGAAACYAGAEGSRATCQITRTPDGTTFTATSTTHLAPKENLTFAVGFTPGTFPVAYTPVPDWAIWANGRWWVTLIPGLGLLALIGATLQRWWVTRSRDNRVVAVAFQPPKDLPVFAAADLMGVPERAPAATLLDLVVRKIATITSTEKPGAPAVSRQPGKELGWWQRRQLRASMTVTVSKLDETMFPDSSARKVVAFLFPPGNRRLDRHLTAVEAADAAQIRARYMKKHGWRRAAPGRPWWLHPAFVVMLFVGVIVTLVGASRRPEWPLGICLAVVGVVLLIAAVYRVPSQGQLTRKGEDARRELLGLREFVTMAEANRIAWLQSAESAPRIATTDTDLDAESIVKLYEPLLPYALIFGVEKTWSQVIGEHVQQLPEGSDLGSVFASVGSSLSYGDMVDIVHTSQPYHRWTSAESTSTGGATFDSINDGIASGFNDFSSAIDDMANSSNDGGGSSSGGSSWSSSSGSSWSSGGSSGGGSSGGGMGGGGGGGW